MEFTAVGTKVNEYSVYRIEVSVTGYEGEAVIGTVNGQNLSLFFDGQQNPTTSVFHYRDIGNYSSIERNYYLREYNLTYDYAIVITPPIVSFGGLTVIEGTDFDDLYYKVRKYFDRPGQSTITLEIPINGMNLTFTSALQGISVTEFIDDDTEITIQ